MTAAVEVRPDPPPFGIAVLQSLSLRRVGVVALTIVAAESVRLASLLSVPIEEWMTRRGAVLSAHLAAALPLLLAVTIVDNLSAASGSARRALAFGAAVLGGAVLSALLYMQLRGIPLDQTFRWSGQTVHLALVVWLRFVFFGGLLTTVLFFVTRERAAALAAHRAEMARVSFDRQMTEARLQLLQAQIEPHFLFNTLAHVGHLYATDPVRGRAMLHDLIAYLRAALPQMREAGSTLGRELALARAYLNLLQVRMGARLEVEIDVPPSLWALELPPMMLATLVENAVKHGIGPLPQGGTVRVVARRNADRLEVEVIDNGAGFRAQKGGGVGLANTRARLASLYGARAGVTLATNPSGGVQATIAVPVAA